jgi:hypothetical protein
LLDLPDLGIDLFLPDLHPLGTEQGIGQIAEGKVHQGNIVLPDLPQGLFVHLIGIEKGRIEDKIAKGIQIG